MFDIQTEVEDIYEKMVEWRRRFHRHPELSNREFETAKFVATHLKAINLDEVWEGVGGTGVIGILKGAHPGMTVAFRADMDALPIEEDTGLPYSSEIPGVMHACGHDGHTAMLMATAEILSRHRDELHGTVKFLFQPGEEGGQGALHMVQDGALEDPVPDVVLGAHMMFNDAGTIAMRAGDVYLSADTVEIRIRGKGGHGAKPHQTNDPLLAACKLVDDFQILVSRKISPLESAVVTVGYIQSGTKENIIPDQAVIKCTVRAGKESTRITLLEGMDAACQGICQLFGTTYEMKVDSVCKPVCNDGKVIRRLETACRRALGENNVLVPDSGRPGSEDFSEYLISGIPGGYLWVGGKFPEEKEASANHQPGYCWDERGMKAGCVAEIASILEFLGV